MDLNYDDLHSSTHTVSFVTISIIYIFLEKLSEFCRTHVKILFNFCNKRSMNLIHCLKQLEDCFSCHFHFYNCLTQFLLQYHMNNMSIYQDYSPPLFLFIWLMQ